MEKQFTFAGVTSPSGRMICGKIRRSVRPGNGLSFTFKINTMQLLKFLPIVLLLSILVLACGEKKESSDQNGSKETPTETSSNKATTGPKDNLINLQNSAIGNNQPAGNNMTQTTPPGINPPHGQPGHDCKIPVGQPLDGSKLTTGNTTQTMTNQGGPRINMTPPASAPATQTPPGINPPHGQPGHDCKIPVGQPLPAAK